MRSHVDRFNLPQLRGQHFRRFHRVLVKQRELLDRTAQQRRDRDPLYDPLIVRVQRDAIING